MRSDARTGWLAALCTLVLGLGATGPARAGAYMSLEEALKLTFPGAERIEKRSFVLTEEQKKRVETLAQAPLDSRLISIHIARVGQQPLGYAFVDVHTVRTVQQGLLVVVGPDGRVASLRVLAFYEPEEFMPSDRFRAQYEGRTLEPDLQLGRGVQGVAGATLSSVATTRAVRRSLALYQVLLGGAEPAAPAGGAAGAGAAADAADAALAAPPGASPPGH